MGRITAGQREDLIMADDDGTTDDATTTDDAAATSTDDAASGDELTQARNEINRLKRVAAEADKKARKAETDKAKADGDFQKLADDANKRADEAEAKAQKVERKQRVTTAAGRLGFKDPADAMRILADEDSGYACDLDDDSAVTRALGQLKKDKAYLLGGGTSRTGGDVTAGDDAPKGGAAEMDRRIRQAAGRS